MPDRYFVDSPITCDRAHLVGGEAHHLAHVMRAKPGHPVTLFDGSGAEFESRVENVGRSSIDLRVIARTEVDRELSRQVTLAVALPKGDRQRWLVEKATELGVTRLVPLIAARGVAQPSTATVARLRRAVIEAAKQCGRNRLMEIAEPSSFQGYLSACNARADRWIAQPHALAGSAKLAHRAPAAHELVFAIGPEGGFTDDEVRAALDRGWRQLDLGRRILRVETAAIAVAAWAALSDEEEPM